MFFTITDEVQHNFGYFNWFFIMKPGFSYYTALFDKDADTLKGLFSHD